MKQGKKLSIFVVLLATLAWAGVAHSSQVVVHKTVHKVIKVQKNYVATETSQFNMTGDPDTLMMLDELIDELGFGSGWTWLTFGEYSLGHNEWPWQLTVNQLLTQTIHAREWIIHRNQQTQETYFMRAFPTPGQEEIFVIYKMIE